MKKRRGAAFLFPPSGGIPPFADSPNQKSAPRFPKIPDPRITVEEMAKRMYEFFKIWPVYSIENYRKNMERYRLELENEKKNWIDRY